MPSHFWWKQKPEKAHETILDRVKGLEEEQKSVHRRNLQNDWLYNASDTPGLGWSVQSRGLRAFDRTLPTDNVVRVGVDTATSIIARQRPRPVVLTDGGNWSTQQRAKELSKFIEGIFRANDVWISGPRIFRDSGIYGTGGWKISKDRSKVGSILIERINIDDIIVDEIQCRTRMEPIELHHRHFVHKEVLKAHFPESATAIELAANDSANRSWTSYRSLPDDMVAVIQSWHVASSPEADDGMEIIAIQGKTLASREYTRTVVPFTFYRWREPTAGFYGRGIAEELLPYQIRLNQVNRFIQGAQDLMSTPRWAVEAGSIVQNAFTNRIGEMLEYRRGYQPPKPFVPDAVKPEMYSYRRELMRSALEQIGISPLAAQSLKPAGLDSAVALREFNDIETQRFAIQAMRLEQAFLELAWRVVETAKEIYEEDGSAFSLWQGKSQLQRIDWSEVEPEDECFCITIEASSLLSRTPSARKQEVIELAQAQLIDKDEGRRLLGHPDLEEVKSLVTASVENVHWKIEQVEKGGKAPPSPYDNVILYVKEFTAALHRDEMEGAPPEVLTALRNHIEMGQLRIRQARQAEMAEQMALQQAQQAQQAQQPQAQPGPPAEAQTIGQAA